MNTRQEQDEQMPDMVRMSAISKVFGGIHALRQVDFAVRGGEIHALLGENGAGKSTLLKILRGVDIPDSGSIEISGKRLTKYSAEISRRSGVAMIFQEMSLVPTLTAAQNIFLNREPRNRCGLIGDRQAAVNARSLFDSFGVNIDPAAPVSELSPGEQQIIEIIKAVSQQSRILILDEPTSALSTTEVTHLSSLLCRLKVDGVAIIYVSHRMEEIMQIADRATILRDGRHVITAPLTDLTLEAIIEQMTGKRGGSLAVASSRTAPFGPPALELRAVSGAKKLRDIDLVLHRGEVLGIAGLLGSGRSSLARLLYGMEKSTGGEYRVNGKNVRLANPRAAINAGIALVPEDRTRQGIIAQHSVASNVCLPVLDQISRHSWIFTRCAARVVQNQIGRLHIKTPSPDAAVNTLSGGNQQKVVLGKWLALDPEILILDEPTAGVDIGSKAEIIALIRDLAHEGKSVLLISSEMAELLAASDRIVVMASGRIVGEVPRQKLEPGDSAHLSAAERLQYAERELQYVIQNVNAYVN